MLQQSLWISHRCRGFNDKLVHREYTCGQSDPPTKDSGGDALTVDERTWEFKRSGLGY